MQKHDKMVALAKEKSAEMTETAITAIETMYRKNIKISVAELTKLTGLSRGFFYNNPNVKQVMMELKEKQQGIILRNPKSDAIAKAQEARIKSLEQKLSLIHIFPLLIQLNNRMIWVFRILLSIQLYADLSSWKVHALR